MEGFFMAFIKRGQVYYVDFGTGEGSEQWGIRPAVIVQNDIGNKYSQTTIVVPCTSRAKNNMPTHVTFFLKGIKNTVLAEQIRVIQKSRIKEMIGKLSDEEIKELNSALEISIGLST